MLENGKQNTNNVLSIDKQNIVYKIEKHAIMYSGTLELCSERLGKLVHTLFTAPSIMAVVAVRALNGRVSVPRCGPLATAPSIGVWWWVQASQNTHVLELVTKFSAYFRVEYVFELPRILEHTRAKTTSCTLLSSTNRVTFWII